MAITYQDIERVSLLQASGWNALQRKLWRLLFILFSGILRQLLGAFVPPLRGLVSGCLTARGVGFSIVPAAGLWPAPGVLSSTPVPLADFREGLNNFRLVCCVDFRVLQGVLRRPRFMFFP